MSNAQKKDEMSVQNKSLESEFLTQLDLKEKQIEKLLQQNQDLVHQKKHLESVLEGILGSTSWKCTKPLRQVMELRRKIFPLVRRGLFSFSAQTAGDITASSASEASPVFTVCGQTPSLTLVGNQTEMPTGWCTLRFQIESEQSHMAFYLYYKTGEGFTGGERYLLSVRSGVQEQFLINLPSTAKARMLDPFDAKQSFRITRFEFAEAGSAQVSSYLFNKHVSPLLSEPSILFRKAVKAFRLLRSGGLVALRMKLVSDDLGSNYQEWVKRFDTLSNDDRTKIRADISQFTYTPVVSVVMPTFNTPEQWLRKAIESVQSQLYQNWELCIADDASTNSEVRAVLEEFAAHDPRIKIAFRSQNGHIAVASNSALELATGEYVALLDHDDELSEHALYMIVSALNQNKELDLLYSDEDKLTSYGMRFNPYFKPDWNSTLLLSQNYVCHLSVFRRSLLTEIGGFRTGTEGAQDWDLILRASEKTTPERIHHIPHILYHWRVIEGSTAQSTSYKPYVLEAQKKSVSEHLERVGIQGAQIEILHDIAQLRPRLPVPEPEPLVSLIIPTRDMVGLLKQCVDSIDQSSSYRSFEVIIVDNGSEERETLEYFESLKSRPHIRVLRDESPFNFSRLNNRAVREARGALIGFLNNDLELITEEWLEEMVAYAVRPEVGAVGARLWFPSNLLQHAGVILGIGGVAGHNHKGRQRGDPGYFNRTILPGEFSAVTAACLLMRRSVFEEISGFNEVDFSVAFNDIDLCLRIRERGYKIIYTPYAEFYHHESASRGYENTPEKFLRFEQEIQKMKDRWGEALEKDPCYNPNLTLLHEDYSFSFPPRSAKPWLR